MPSNLSTTTAPATHGHTESPVPGTQVHPSLQASTWAPPVPALSPTRYPINHTQERRQRQLQRQSDLAARQRAYLESNQPELRIARQPTQQHSQQSSEQASQQPSLPDFQRSDSISQHRNEPPYSALGTREEIENADYQSPVGAMFGRAYNPSAEQAATSPTSHVPHGHLIASFIPAPPREHRENPFTPRSGRRREALTSTSQVDYREELQRQHAEIIMRERPHVLSAGRAARRPYRMSEEELALHRGLPPDYFAWHPPHPGHMPPGHPPYEPYYESESDSEQVTFDTQERPPPMKPESMIVDLACTICKEHLVDTVVMPCMHAVMCNWCAELQIPGKRGTPHLARDRTAKCPLCRTRVKEKRKIFHS
jgi:hypothetical protein